MEAYIKGAIRERWKMIRLCVFTLILIFGLLWGMVYGIGVIEGDTSNEDYIMCMRVVTGLGIVVAAVVATGIVKQMKQNAKVWMMFEVMSKEEQRAFENVLNSYQDAKNQMIVSESALCAMRTKLGIVNAENDCILFLYREVTKLVYNYAIAKHTPIFEVYVYTGKMKQKLNLVKNDDAIRVYQLLNEKCPYVPVEFKGLSKAYFMKHQNMNLTN